MVLQQTIQEVIQAVLEQGEISKYQCLESWGLDESAYKDLQRAILQYSESIESGPQGIGGFVAKKRRGRFIDEVNGDDLYLGCNWEKHAVDRLSTVLSHAELESSLGPLLQTVRQVRRYTKGVDRRGTKRELAGALVLQCGIDLFCIAKIRERVAAACKTKHPKKWCPGKTTAIDFVERTGFPLELAGIPTPDTLPDYEYLEGSFQLHRLQDFQREVKDDLLATINTPGDHAIVTLPTGAGKTRVAVECIREWLTALFEGASHTKCANTVLWLAHTEELCEQAYTCFKQVWEASEYVCPLYLIRFWGHYTQELTSDRLALQQFLNHSSVLISTPQRIVNILTGRTHASDAIINELKAAIGLILIDEAHRAAAPMYRQVMTNLLSSDRAISVAGLTATPFRMEYLGDDPEEGTRELRDIFGKLIEPMKSLGENPRQKLQDRGILARPEFVTIETPTTMQIPNLPSIDAFGEEDIERIDRVMAVKTDNTPRRMAILKHLIPIAVREINSVLYFGPSVNDAECMAYLLRCEGINAAVISGKTRDVTRRKVVSDFKQGVIRVLCNCEVLTTGFDAPKVTHVVMARPTVSRVLYEQILGRGLRGPVFGGTESCVILDCHDSFRGDRPPLGYESFRRVWQEEVSHALPFHNVPSLDLLEAELQEAL